MIYLIIFLILVLLSIMEYYTTDYAKRKCMLYISFFIVLFFCTLRYNVGFDSEVYLSLYTKVPNSLFANDNLSNFREEYLFLKYFVLLKNIGITPPFAIAITIAIINLLFFRFIYKYSPYKCFSVLVLFSWYFTYIFSTLRQGLAMGIFLCIAYPFLEQKKYIKYYIVVLIATFFHNSTFIAFFLPLFLNTLRKASRFSIIVLFIISFVVALVPNPLLQSLATIVNQGGAYVENLGTSYVALANRVLAFGIVFFLYNTKNKQYEIMRYIYMIGFLIFLWTAQSELISSRLGAIFKSFDIILIPCVLTCLPNKYNPVFMLAMYVYLGFMFMHLLSGMAFLSGYNDVWNYPYNILFGKDYYYDNW